MLKVKFFANGDCQKLENHINDFIKGKDIKDINLVISRNFIKYALIQYEVEE